MRMVRGDERRRKADEPRFGFSVQAIRREHRDKKKKGFKFLENACFTIPLDVFMRLSMRIRVLVCGAYAPVSS